MGTPTKKSRLKDRQLERFCREYVDNGHNGAKAARAVGKSEGNAAQWASEQLRKPKVLQRVMDINDGHIESLIYSKEEALAELNELATFDIRDAYDDDGNLLPIHQMSKAAAAAVKEVEMFPNGKVAGAKFLDVKHRAVVKMLEYHNAFEDHQKSGSGEVHIHFDEKDEQA